MAYPKLKTTKRDVKAKELAERFGCSTRTIYRAWSQSREEYEANSYMRTKPWEPLGICRMTWYNYNKPMTPEELAERRAKRKAERLAQKAINDQNSS